MHRPACHRQTTPDGYYRWHNYLDIQADGFVLLTISYPV